MGVFRTKDCICLCWSADGKLRGVRAQADKGKLRIVASKELVAETPASETLDTAADGVLPVFAKIGGRMVKALLELDPTGEAHVAAGGPIPGELVFELGMPSLKRKEDFASALAFELPRQAPGSAEELVWRAKLARASEGVAAIRVWTAPKRNWDALLEGISAAEAKIDLVMNPLMADLPQEAEGNVFMPQIESGYALRLGADSLASMEEVSASESESLARAFADSLSKSFKIEKPYFDAVAYAPCLALAWHVLKGGAKSEIRAPETPASIRPKRFKGLKAACFALLCLNVALALGYGGRLCHQRWSRMGEIRAEKQSIQAKLSKLKASNASSANVDKLLKLAEGASTGNGEALHCLQFLSETLPDRVWLSEFSASPDKIDLSIKGDGDWEASSVRWDKRGTFSAEGIRKNRNPDGSAETKLRLACKDPNARRG